MPKIGVVSFPGTNCETESLRALQKVGLEAVKLLWNESEDNFKDCDGYFLAGGFSYEDRGRSGVVAAHDTVMKLLKKEAVKGKPVLGICNGAQILVESGLVTDSNVPQVALTINKREIDNKIQGIGFYHDWCYVTNNATQGRSIFNNFSGVQYMPLAHGEGRFEMNEDTYQDLLKNEQLVFTYANEKGENVNEYPSNPNGSSYGIAGICNKAGNVLALMPHPERSMGKGDALFQSLANWFNNGGKKSMENIDNQQNEISYKVQEKPERKLEFFIEEIITDNSEETISSCLGVPLKRRNYYTLEAESITPEFIKDIITSDELANIQKEKVYICHDNKYFLFQSGQLVPVNKSEVFEYDYALYVYNNEDVIAQEKQEILTHIWEDVSHLKSAVVWYMRNEDKEGVLKSGVLASPVSMHLEYGNNK